MCLDLVLPNDELLIIFFKEKEKKREKNRDRQTDRNRQKTGRKHI